MFKSRKSESAVSPLDRPSNSPPIASTFPRSQNRHSMAAYPNSGGGTVAGPAYDSGSPVDRVMSGGSVNSKSEKRRSFFGFGKKDKVESPPERPRPTSFSGPPQAQQYRQNSNGEFQPHSMRQYPPPKAGQPLPPAPSQGGRVASNPNQQSSEFGERGTTFPRSQSVGYNARQGMNGGDPPSFNSRPEASRSPPPPAQSAQQGMPRSTTVPNRMTAPVIPAANGNGSGSSSPGTDSSAADHTSTANDANRPIPIATVAQGQPSDMAQMPAWMREFSDIVDLIGLQPQKTYVASPPELEMILARTSAGGQPKQGQPGSITNDWDAVWLQLSGISLSMWSMKETRAAAAKGEKVPPTYFNITDSSLELLAPLPPPPHRPNSHPHHFVYSLNTAGSNRLLFSCPTERDLARWATGMRLAAWERSRLEEIYTGHLIKSGGKEPKSELVRGRMEGWVRVRVMGGTDWKRLWVVLTTPNTESAEDEKKNRRRSFFGMGDKEKEPIQEPNTGVPMASFYLEPRTQKNRTSPAVLTVTNVTQAYAVFPERLEVMSQSNLLKAVGRIGGEMVTIEGRLRDSGWALIMPENGGDGVGPQTQLQTPLQNMMKWVTGFHDVFKLYGRPNKYSWDRKDSKALFFGYPQGPDKGQLFLDLDDALRSDFRGSNLGNIRNQFTKILERRITQPAEQYRAEDNGATPRVDGDYRLPPLTFGNDPKNHSYRTEQNVPRSLTPITERSIASRQNSTGTNAVDRNVSGSSNKQSSGASTKLPSATSEEPRDRLATITDNEGFALTDEPEETIKPESWTDPNASTQEGTAGSAWSQDTGATPTRQTSMNGTPPNIIPPPGLAHTDSDGSGSTTKGLPDLPVAGVDPSARLATPLPVPSPNPSTAMPSPVPPPGAAAAVISPTPQRPSGLQNEYTAQGLLDVGSASPAPRFEGAGRGSATPTQPLPIGANANGVVIRNSPSPEKPRPTIITNFDPPPSTNGTQARPDLGRKPSGARPVPRKTMSGPRLDSVPSEPIEEVAPPAAAPPIPASTAQSKERRPSTIPDSAIDFGEDAAAYMSYAEQASPEKVQPIALAPAPTTAPVPPPAPAALPSSSAVPAATGAAATLLAAEEVRSSFAPSKAATERKAKADAAAAETRQAMSQPGGGKRAGGAKGGWSSDEDEEESPVAPTTTHKLPSNQAAAEAAEARAHPSHPPQRSASGLRALPAIPRLSGGPTDLAIPLSGQNEPARRSPDFRALPPQPPIPQFPSQYANPPPATSPPAQPPQPPAARTNVWNANFAADHGMSESKSGKFIDLEPQNERLTQAFAPHGLLQAGMQDKEDRSAKRQEEVARETGGSLVSVPTKPPPPSQGLLGAVSAHERDRAAAGGLGAMLTDRERERRAAEDRQREIEKLQRQQMEHMRQFGGQDFQQQGQGYPSPYGMQMGNMGMMMPQMGYGYGGYNPYQQQAMMAAQMAYHQAMMSMSQAGSQAGGNSPDRPSSPASIHSGSQFAHAPQAAPYPWQGGMPMPPYGWPGSPPPQMWGASPAGSPGLSGMPPGSGGGYPYPGWMGGMPGMPGSPIGMGGMGGQHGDFGSNEYLMPRGRGDGGSDRSRGQSNASASRDGRPISGVETGEGKSQGE